MLQNILYIPGFQEEKVGRPIGLKISHCCDAHNMSFESIVFPGDTDSDPDTETEFSLSALQKVIKIKIISLLESGDKDIIITSYSLSARPTIDAIGEVSQDYQKRIHLKLIHPAINPLIAVQEMEFVRRCGKGTHMHVDEFLRGRSECFESLILNWIGNSEEFSKNLGEDFSNINFKTLESDIMKIITIKSVILFSSGNDMIIGETPSQGSKWTQVLRSHFPSEKLFEDFFKSLSCFHP